MKPLKPSTILALLVILTTISITGCQGQKKTETINPFGNAKINSIEANDIADKVVKEWSDKAELVSLGSPYNSGLILSERSDKKGEYPRVVKWYFLYRNGGNNTTLYIVVNDDKKIEYRVDSGGSSPKSYSDKEKYPKLKRFKITYFDVLNIVDREIKNAKLDLSYGFSIEQKTLKNNERTFVWRTPYKCSLGSCCVFVNADTGDILGYSDFQ